MIGKPVENLLYTDAQKGLRWHVFKNEDPEVMFDLFVKPQVDNLTVFDHMKQVGSVAGVFAEYMKGATFMIPTPRLLDQVVQMIDKIQMDDRDTKGDLIEIRAITKIVSHSSDLKILDHQLMAKENWGIT